MLDGGPPTNPAPGRAILVLVTGERTIATLEHDDTWAQEPGVLEALARALTLAIENRRLHDSRALLVRTADAERRRLENDLHDGAQQRLVALGLLLGRLRDDVAQDPILEARIAQAEHLLAEGIDELRTLARGARPSLLLLHGVVGAVRQLAHDGSRRTSPRSACTSRAASASSAHASASRRRTANGATSSSSSAALQLSTSRGGVWMRPGGGLEGLWHRVEALGGTLLARSGETGRSVVRASLPWPAVDAAAAELRLAGGRSPRALRHRDVA